MKPRLAAKYWIATASRICHGALGLFVLAVKLFGAQWDVITGAFSWSQWTIILNPAVIEERQGQKGGIGRLIFQSVTEDETQQQSPPLLGGQLLRSLPKSVH